MHLIFPETSHWPTFLLPIVWVYLQSNLCSGLQKTHLFCTRMRFRRSKSSKVDDFGTNRKRVCDFLLVGHCDYGPILHRFWDTATYWPKLPIFATPLIRRPRSLCSLWNFALKLTMRKLVMGLSYSEHGMIAAWVVLWRTDRQTDGFTIASTALCYADTL